MGGHTLSLSVVLTPGIESRVSSDISDFHCPLSEERHTTQRHGMTRVIAVCYHRSVSILLVMILNWATYVPFLRLAVSTLTGAAILSTPSACV